MTNNEQKNAMGIPLESVLRKQLYYALQGDVVTAILKEARVGKIENPWRYMLEGHSFKVDANISGKMYKLFHEVKEKLGFTAPLDFYITSSGDINAFAVSSLEEDEPHIININSAMLHLMNDEELKFVIGHEIGHLISKNADLHKLIYFVFPPSSNQPTLLQNKIRLWNQLSELIADRFGFLACPDLPTCISAFFKMSSGLDAHRVELDISAFLSENQQRLDYFTKDNGLNIASHPVNPVRVKAIELFSKSKRFASEGTDLSWYLNDQEIEKQMDELTEVLMKIKNSEIDYHRSHFIAAAGLIIAGIDGDVHEKEIEMLTRTLSDFMIFPRSFLQSVHESGKVPEIFNAAVKQILEINPSEREGMLSFMINMVMADKKIESKELGFIFGVGEQAFGYSKKEVAQIFAESIQKSFVPSTNDLS
jgi:Zn-dependent protease with chaperone function/uncharacterized tellurite resistance protein B-like protein